MKKILFLITLTTLALNSSAQYRSESKDESSRGFSKDKLFTGGSVNLSFSTYTTNLGIAPQFGISLTDWMDAGVNVNINYSTERDPYSPDKWRKTTIGPGAFVRLFPVNFLFASIQYEYNFITFRYITSAPSGNQTLHVRAPSLLLGAGYAGGRMKGNNTYFYFSVSGDFLGNKNSPHIDSYERMLPVVRAGYNIGLFQGRSRNMR